MSSVHKASLIHPSLHSQVLLDFLGLDITRYLVEKLVATTVDAVCSGYSPQSTPSTSNQIELGSSTHPRFSQFVSTVVNRTQTTPAVLLVAIVYIERAKPHLSINNSNWAFERVCLGGLILANKYTNDATLKNKHWALATGIFGKRDIGRIEREFLDVLDWDLGVSEQDIMQPHASIFGSFHQVPAYSPPPSYVQSMLPAEPPGIILRTPTTGDKKYRQPLNAGIHLSHTICQNDRTFIHDHGPTFPVPVFI